MIVTDRHKEFRRVLEISTAKAIGSRLHKTSLSALKSMYRRPNLTFGGKLKRVSKLVAVLAAAVLITTGCSSSSSDNAGADVKVGLAYDIGGRGDKSFNDSAALGLDEAKAEFGVEAKEVTVTTGSDSEREDKLRLLAEAGYNPIIAVGFLYAVPLKAVAADYPDINFAIIDDASVAAPNVAGLVFAEEQGSYLAGVAAALESKSGKIGYIGGVRIPLLQKFEAGFVAGVKATKASATVDVKYVTEPPDFGGFNDPAKAKVIAKGMIDKGADVIYSAAGGSGAGNFAAAIDAGAAGKKVWTIGVDSDQYLNASAAEQANMLTSMLKRVDRAVYDVISAAVNGTTVNDVLDAAAGTVGRVYGLELDGVGVSYSGDYITKYKDQIDKAAADIKSGAITVPTTP
jgi:basic membrane protein A and related proteins